MRKYIWFVCLLIGLLSGCSSKSEIILNTNETDSIKNSVAETENVTLNVLYDKQLLDVGSSMDEIDGIVSGGGELYVYGNNKEMLSGTTSYICEYAIERYSESTGETKTIFQKQGVVDLILGIGEGNHVIQAAVSPDGNLIVLECLINEVDNKQYQLIKYDKKGNELWSTEPEMSDRRKNIISCVGNKTLLIADNCIMIYSETGSLVKRISFENRGEISQVFPAGDNKIFAVYESKSGQTQDMLLMDLSSEICESIHERFWKDRYTNIYSSYQQEYDLLLWDRMSLLGWNVGDEEPTMLVDFLASGIDGSKLRYVVTGEKEQIFISMEDEAGKVQIYSLSNKNLDKLPTKEIIYVGCFQPDKLIKHTLRFNQESEEYQIMLVDYSMYGIDNQLTRLNMDILTGNMPDLILLDDYYEMPIESYIRQGLLEDLYLWLSSDSNLNLDDYLTNVFAAYEVNGKLYQIPTTFYISTFVAKKSIVGDRIGWTLDELFDLMDEYPGSSLFDGWVVRNTILREILQSDLFVDSVNKTCNFNSVAFVELLKCLDKINEKEDWSKLWPLHRDNKVLVSKVALNSFDLFQWVTKRTFGEEVTYFNIIGDINSSGFIQNGEIRLAMSAQSQCKEGAWEFIRYFLAEEYQKAACSSNNPLFPVNIKVLEWLGEQELLSNNEDSYSLNGEEIIVPAMTQEDIDKTIEYIKSAGHTGTLDYEILNIVTEELEFFFSKQKKAEDVAEIIQRRVSLYLSELK